IWMHQAVAGRVQTRHRISRKLVSQIDNLGSVRRGLRRTNLFLQCLAIVNGVTTEIFDDKTDVIGSCEAFKECFQQKIGSLAVDRSADKQELERFLCRERERDNAGPELLWIESVRYNLHLRWWHSRIDIDTSHVF